MLTFIVARKSPSPYILDPCCDFFAKYCRSHLSPNPNLFIFICCWIIHFSFFLGHNSFFEIKVQLHRTIENYICVILEQINRMVINDQSSKCNATFSFIKGKDYRYHYVYISNDQIHSRWKQWSLIRWGDTEFRLFVKQKNIHLYRVSLNNFPKNHRQ